MTSAVLDTSVTVAWYLPEVFSESDRAWQGKLLSDRASFFVPSLHYWEFANVMKTYVRKKEIESDVGREIWLLHLDAPIEIAEPDRSRVLQIALEYEATAYDAVYIALALDLDLPLLTAERPSTPWVVKLGARAITLQSG